MSPAEWNRKLAEYARPDIRRSLVQLVVTLSLLGAASTAAFFLYAEWGVFASLPMSIFMGLLLVRVFIIQHDCGHRSFLPSRKACDRLGQALSVLTLTPFEFWRRDHDQHHAGAGNLERRGIGDIDTLTVAEFRALSPLRKVAYRAYRNPVVLFGIGPSWQFLIRYRFPLGLQGSKAKDDLRSVLLCNAAVAAVLCGAGWLLGFWAVASVWVPAVAVAATAGVWLFYVQHQFEDTYWRRQKEWSFVDAALKGCSLYNLPGWMHWMSGWIGFHHVHHLSSRIPNYNLKRAHESIPELQSAPMLGLMESLRCVRLALWCEARGKMVSFREAALSPA